MRSNSNPAGQTTCQFAFFRLVEAETNVWENSRADQLKNSHKLCRGFCQAIKARRTCFISFIKLLFSFLTKSKIKTMIYTKSVCVYFNFFHERVNFHNLEKANYVAKSFLCFIVLWKHTRRPIKTRRKIHIIFNVKWMSNRSKSNLKSNILNKL